MTQMQAFYKNIIDSTLSISLDLNVIHNSFKRFIFNSVDIKREGEYFTFTLRKGDSDHLFIINIYRTLKSNLFGKSYNYYLSVETRKKTSYSYTTIGHDYITESNFDKVQLKKMYDFLEKRVSDIKFRDQEAKYSIINSDLVKFIDKSLTRNEKLEDLLKK